jgi:hypothetical protein
MRRLAFTSPVLLAAAAALATAAPPSPSRPAASPLPTVDGVQAVAVVNGEPISLAEVERQLATLHMQSAAADGTAPARQDPSALLDRMITAKLIAQEARSAGFDEEPEFRAALDDVKRSIVRDILVARETASLKPDAAAVEQAYKELVREYTMGSVFFASEKDAKEFETKIKAGADFFKTAKAARDAGKAKGPETAQKHKQSDMLPGVARLLSMLKPGQTGPIMQSKNEWAIIHLVSVSYPDDPNARLVAQEKALESKREAAIERYAASLRAKYAKVDEKLLTSLDFEKKEALDTLGKDTRTLATIKGDAPVTVADLAKGMERRYFHGVEKAANDPSKHINTEKEPVLDDVINRRVIVLEGKAAKIEESREYKDRLQRAEEQMLFDQYVKRAILPEVKVVEADIEAYYAKHQKDYTAPEMVQLETLDFAGRADAQEAFARLQKGADWNWLKSNAPGLVTPKQAAELDFPKGLVAMAALPGGVQKTLKGARPGDYRFYEASANGPYQVLVVRDLRASQVQKLEAVRKPIADKVYAEKLAQTVEKTAAEVRKASEVKVYATGEQLKKLIMRDLQGGN